MSELIFQRNSKKLTYGFKRIKKYCAYNEETMRMYYLNNML